MRRNLGLRIGLVIVVIAVSLWYLYPPRSSINLGLDLQGGIHLVLGVEVDKALEAQVERAGDTAFTTAAEVMAAFDRREADQGAGRIVMTLKPREATQIRELAVRQGLETIRNRVDQFGVAEPSIQQQGENRILVQLPGVQDPARAKALIGKTALLEFKLVDDKVDPESALRSGVPDGDEMLYHPRVDKETHQERKVPFVVQKKAYVTGRDVATARVSIDQNTSEPYVSVDFNAAGGKAFSDLTDANVGRRLAIVLDGNIHSAPQIREPHPSRRAQITGGFSSAEATDLPLVLRAGARPAPVQVLEERRVGGALGADSVRQGIIAILASTA